MVFQHILESVLGSGPFYCHIPALWFDEGLTGHILGSFYEDDVHEVNAATVPEPQLPDSNAYDPSDNAVSPLLSKSLSICRRSRSAKTGRSDSLFTLRDAKSDAERAVGFDNLHGRRADSPIAFVVVDIEVGSLSDTPVQGSEGRL